MWLLWHRHAGLSADEWWHVNRTGDSYTRRAIERAQSDYNAQGNRDTESHGHTYDASGQCEGSYCRATEGGRQ